MKKIMMLFVSVLLITACADEDTDKIELETQEKRLEINAKNIQGMLVGVANKESFLNDETYKVWFQEKYDNYNPNSETLKELKNALKGVEIRAYMGTWCPDSRREVPNFYKIMDEIGFADFDMICTDNSRPNKKANGLEKGYNIRYVPAFILFKNNKEIGRFVERAMKGSLEKDLLYILTKDDYKPFRQ